LALKISVTVTPILLAPEARSMAPFAVKLYNLAVLAPDTSIAKSSTLPINSILEAPLPSISILFAVTSPL